MKKWNTCEIVEIDFAETKNGGKVSECFDQQWFDQNGALHVNFEDGLES